MDEVGESNLCYDEILRYDSHNKFALNNKAANLQRVGQFEEALPLINEVLKIDPNFINAIINKTNILKGLKQSKDALAFLDEKNDLLQKSINLQTTKVDLLIEILDLREAYRINEEILKIESNFYPSTKQQRSYF